MAALNRIDMSGQKINMLYVIGPVKKEGKSKKVYWECQCDCGKTVVVDAMCLRRTPPNFSCGCQKSEAVRAKLWKGYEQISGCYWGRLQSGAKNRQLIFDLSIEQGWDLYLAQDKKCGLTGLPIDFSTSVKRKKEIQTASLDRIDSGEGYFVGNVMWIHKAVNRLKTNMSNKDLIYWCRLIANHNGT